MKYEPLPFDESEMIPSGEYKLPFPGAKPIMKPSYKISPKENYKRFVDGEPAWLPTDIDTILFNPTIIPENIARAMPIEMERVTPDQFGGKDFFGIEWEFVPTAQGSMVRPGNPTVEDINDWENIIKFPDISKYDWEGCKERNKMFLDPTRIKRTTIFTGFFERLISFMDMENALVAMIDEDSEDAVKRLFDKLADFYIEVIGYMKKYFDIDMLWFHDDWGNQRAPMFSLDTVMNMVVPYLKRVVDATHEMGIIFELHSCGKIEQLVPAMIEAGVDMWDGQYMNDKEMLCKKYGDKIKFGVDIETKPDMSDEELRACVVSLLDKYDKNVYIGGLFTADYRLYPMIYEETRKRYNS